jgi:hypothetical protein
MPQLTPLQYLTLHLLFTGPQTGRQLRAALRAMGVRQSLTSFSRLMMRLAIANLVIPNSRVRRTDLAAFREYEYQVTDLGLWMWTQSRKFYLNLAPPSPDLLPAETDVAPLAAYDPKTRKKILDDRFGKAVRQTLQTAVDALRRQSG